MDYASTLRSAIACGLILLTSAVSAKEVVEPAGTLPVMQEVDVVVVGGTSGGVEAAVAAAKRGAKVFLAAPRPYLGEDICATYRLWLEPGETPATGLAGEVFASRPQAPPAGPALSLTYTADKPSANTHKDSNPPSKLTSGQWHNAAGQSVQFDEDVTLVLDLAKEQNLARVGVMAYQRNDDFEVGQVTVWVSPDKAQWKQLAVIKNDRLGQGSFESTALSIAADVNGQSRYLKLEVRKGPQSKRILLGQIVVEGPRPAQPAVAQPPRITPVTPMQVKRTLDQALIKAGVPFLYASFTTDILRDAQGKPAGIVIANRSGRQAVIAKVIIDATEQAIVARMAGAQFTEYRSGTQVFRRVVVGGETRPSDTVTLSPRPSPITITAANGVTYPAIEYQVQVSMRDRSVAAFAQAEQLARDWTWTNKAVDGSETLFQVPPDSFRGKSQQTGVWPGADKLPLGCFQPAGSERLFVLSGCADISRPAATELVRPVNLMAVGARLGQAAAELAQSQPRSSGVHLAGETVVDAMPGQVQGVSASFSPQRSPSPAIPAQAHGLPVLGEYDVVVIGGGTGGAPAAIAAGRQEAKTLLIEYLHGLGGVGTVGYISSYYHGNRVGFTRQIDEGVASLGEKNSRAMSGWDPERKSEWYRQELRRAGVEIWYGMMGTGAVVENGRVKGVVVLTPQGRGVVLAKVVIDSTGNADIAAAAGATCRYTDATDVAVQGTGLPQRELGQRSTNTDYTFVDDTDVFDIWRSLVTARQKFKTAYDLGQLIDTRERRQIVGDFTLTPMDMILSRTHPDTVVVAMSNFDSHGYIVHPVFMLRPPDRKSITVHMPYRCLLPRGLDGILVTGLGVSAHRDAIPVIRMQPDVQNQGYAAGVAAAMIGRQGCTTRQLDIKALQKHLVQIGNLPETVLTEQDSFPLSNQTVAAAVESVAKDYDKLEVVLAQFEIAQPLLRQALQKADTAQAKLIYAHILAMMGDGSGADALLAAVSSAKWDKGWSYTGMGQFGPCMSSLDSQIIALGRTRDKRAVQPIIDKIPLLNTDSEFSHFRAVAMAMETLADPAAAKPLAELLQKPGLGGHAVTTIAVALEDIAPGSTQNLTRDRALRELYLARALYRCGDYQGIGRKTLSQFAQDLHGHYARHAQAVLAK